MDTSAFLHYLTVQPAYRAQIAHIEHIPPRNATYAELDKPLEGTYETGTKPHGYLLLYTRKAEAVNTS